MPIWKNFFTSNFRISSSFLHIFLIFYFLKLWRVIQWFLNSSRTESIKFWWILIKCAEFVNRARGPGNRAGELRTVQGVRGLPLPLGHARRGERVFIWSRTWRACIWSDVWLIFLGCAHAHVHSPGSWCLRPLVWATGWRLRSGLPSPAARQRTSVTQCCGCDIPSLSKSGQF
jgi:hypothetical protein